jgi:hypothetical protein
MAISFDDLVPNASGAASLQAPMSFDDLVPQSAPDQGGGVMGALKGASRALEANLPFVDRAVAATKSGDYATNLAAERNKNEQFVNQNPWTSALGGITASAPLATVGGPTFGLGGLGGRVASAAVPWGVAGAVQGASSSPDLTDLPETAKDSAIGGASGAALGAAVPLAAAGVGKAISPFAVNSERQALVDALRQAGVNPTAGQVTGNKTLSKLEAAAGDIPFGGGGAEVPREANSRAFTAALMEKAGAQPGEIATPENLSALHETLGNQFDELGARNSITIDPQLRTEIGKAVSDYHDVTGTPAPGVAKTADGLIGDEAEISGEKYNNVRSQFGKQAQALRFSDPAQAQAYRDMQGALDDAMERSIAAKAQPSQAPAAPAGELVSGKQGPGLVVARRMPDGSVKYGESGGFHADLADEHDRPLDADLGFAQPGGPFMSRQEAGNFAQRATADDIGAFQDVRAKYKNLAAIEQAAGSAGSDPARGIVSPAQMRTVLASGNNRRAYARGIGDMAPLTNAGNAVLTNFPQSGTAPRILAAHLLGAGVGGGVGYHEGGLAGALAGVAAPAIGARALMSRPIQSLLANQLMRGPGASKVTSQAALAAALGARQQLPPQRNTGQ